MSEVGWLLPALAPKISLNFAVLKKHLDTLRLQHSIPAYLEPQRLNVKARFAKKKLRKKDLMIKLKMYHF